MDYYQNAGFITLAIIILSMIILYPFRHKNNLFYHSILVLIILFFPCVFWSEMVNQEKEAQTVDYVYTHPESLDFESEIVKIKKLGTDNRYSNDKSNYTNYLITQYTYHGYKIMKNEFDYIIFQKASQLHLPEEVGACKPVPRQSLHNSDLVP